MYLSKPVPENLVCLVILGSLWLNELHLFTSLCMSFCTKWNMLQKDRLCTDKAMQYFFAISWHKYWKVIQEKETQTLLPMVNPISLGCDYKWVSCGCNAASSIKLSCSKSGIEITVRHRTLSDKNVMSGTHLSKLDILSCTLLEKPLS